MTGAPRSHDVEVLLLRLDQDLPAPSYAHPGDAGADLYSAVDVVLDPGQRQLIPTGVSIALPDGYAAFIHPRSGLSVRHGVGMVNAPGTIDAAFRGEIQVNLINHDRSQSVSLKRGDRIAQIIVQKIARAQFAEVTALPGTHRGEGGFGSTG